MITDANIRDAKVLIVDDQAANISLLEQTLKGAGYLSVTSTLSPREVCDLHRSNRYDLIMLDLQMPGMDGFEVMESLKEIEVGSYLPVLVLTAQPAHKIRALQAGAKDFISKPFDLAEVLLRVHNMLEVRLLHAESKKLYDGLIAEQKITARLKPIFRYGPAVVSITTLADGRIIDANEEYCRFFGYSREELIGLTAGELHVWVNPAEREIVMHRLLTEKAIRGFEVKLRRKSGQVCHVLASFELIETTDETEAALIFMSTDITERREAELRLEASEIRYRRLFEAAKDGVLILDAESGMIEDVNPFLVQLLGIPKEEFLRKTIWELGCFQNAVANYEKFKELQRIEYVRYDNLPLETLDGRTISVEFVSNVYLVNGTKVIQCNIRDVTERKHAAEQLRVALEQLQRVLLQSPVVIYTLKVEGDRFIPQFVSENMIRFLGFAPEECNYDWWVTHIHPEDTERVYGSLAETLERGTLTVKYRMANAHGDYVWVDDNRKVIYDAENNPIEVIGAWLDLTERMISEAAIKESERRLREMLENMELLAITLDKSGHVTFCNDFVLRLTERTREETVGSDWFATFIPSTNVTIKQLFMESVEDGTVPPHFENTIITQSGELREIVWNNTMLRDGAGKFIGTASIGEDVTERKLAELKLREEEARYRDLLENANDLILKVAPDGTLLYANRISRETLGYGSEEAVDLTLLSLIDDERREESAKMFARAIQGETIRHFETEFCTKEGKRISVEGNVSATMENGHVMSLRCIFRDVTERKTFEVNMLRNQRMESIGTLAGGIAHDLNNMLTPILISIEVLRPKITDVNSLKILDVLERSALHGADMVRQVLSFSRGVEGSRAEIPVKHMIKEMQTIIEHTFPKSILLQTDIPKDIWTLIGDTTQVHQAMLNLCVNARDAMPSGGTLTIKVENVVLDEYYARMNPEAKAGPYVVFSVTDTGAGIPANVRERIFDPFFTTKSQDKGTGLGLSTVRGILKGHNGFISVYSELGKGSIFKLYFPANLSPAIAGPRLKNPILASGNGELILVVDDDDAIREITQNCLEKFGYVVITARDGAQAIALCAQNKGKLKVLLTDLMMPIMDGFATIRAARTIDPDIKIIAASGLGPEAGTPSSERLGANAFLQKPFTAERLLTVVAEVLCSATTEVV